MKTEAHHAYQEYLLARMADVLGINLDLEVDLTRLSRTQLLNAIDRCTRCPDPQGCEIWLDEHAAGSPEAPRICGNRRLLERLRDRR